jgi:hypothetical protein
MQLQNRISSVNNEEDTTHRRNWHREAEAREAHPPACADCYNLRDDRKRWRQVGHLVSDPSERERPRLQLLINCHASNVEVFV